MTRLYHGTEIERGKRILKKQKMEYSRGGHEWLGDGIYLYRDKLYAYRWITIQYKNQFGTKNLKELFNHYLILNVDIKYDIERVFSFLNPEHQTEYSYIKEKCKQKAALSAEMSKYEFVDGVVLNFMFKKMGYDEKYDMVEAVFSLLEEPDNHSRLRNLTEYQLCIKNPDCIVSICDCTEEFKDYGNKLNMVNAYRTKFSRQGRYSTNIRRTQNGRK